MHVNIKRLLSFLVVLAMVLSMTPVTGIPAIEAKADETESTTVKTTVTDNLVFLEGTQTAYCPVCKKDAEWTDFNALYAENQGALISDSTKVDHFHYYLSANLTYTTTNALQTYEGVCFHLNGFNVIASGEATGRPFSCTQTFRLMGTGTVYGGLKVTTNSGTIMALNGGNASGKLHVYSGTLQNSEGVTAPLLTIGGNGGLINIHGGTVENSGNQAIYAIGESHVADVQISGGTVNGDVQIGSTYEIEARSGKAKLSFTGGTVNGTVASASAAPITIGGNATATSISVGSGSTLTVKEGWSGSAAVTFADGLTATNGVAEGDFTGSLVCDGYKLVNSEGTLVKGDKPAFDAAAATNYCEACGEYVTWTALNDGENTDGTANHYYVAADMTAKANDRLITGVNYKSSGTTYNSVCLHLNGKTLTTGAYKNAAIYCSNGTKINIMGDGTVINGGTGMLFEAYTSDVNLYGGTYISSSKAMYAAGGSTKVYLHNNVKFEGTVDATAGSITLNDSASINGLTLNGGTVTAAEGWTGYLKNADGKYLELVDGAWTAVTKTPVWGEFDPVACDGYAYCEACGQDAEPVLWTAVKGNNRIGYFGDGNHHHYYLTGDLNMPSNLSQLASVEQGSKLCVNLNGYNITYGGRVYVGANCLLNIFGDGNVTFTGDTTATHATQDYKSAGFHLGATTAVLNLYGGTYSVSGAAKEDGKPTVLTTGKVTLKNATVNGYIAANKGSNIRLEGTAAAEDIRIADTGKVVVAAGWSGTASLTVPESAFENGVLAAANGSAEGDFTGALTCNGVELSNQGGTLMADITFNPDAETNYCRACKTFVAWEALPEKVPTIGTEGACLHYYVPADMTSTGEKNAFLFVADSNGETANVAPTVCLYLNNKTLTLTQYLYGGFGGVFSVIGDGTLTTTGNTLITPYTSTVNLYGGTYIAKTGGKALTMGGSGAKVNLYGDAELQGEAAVSQGALTVYDQAVLTNLNISGGKTTFKTGWSGSAVVSVEEALVTDNVVSTNSAYVEGDITGTLTSSAGFTIKVENNALVLNNPDKDVFAPWDYNGYAYCTDCGNLVEWTDYNAHVAANGFYYDGANLSVPNIVDNLHFYLSADLAYTKNVLCTYENVTFNLNGFDVYPVAEEGADTITASYAFSSTQKMALINTAEEMSTVTGWNTKAGTGTVLYQGGGGATSHAYIYENITLKTADGCTTDAPVVQVGPNGGRMYLKGGIIDASNKTNTKFPTAVYVGGQAKNSSGNPSVGKFYLESGEIKGGTATNGAGTIRVGTDSTDDKYVDGACFYMTGGKVSGGNGKDGGNIYAGTTAAEISITGGIVTGGIAQNGGNIYSNGATLTIGEGAVISDGFLPYTTNSNAGNGGGNIWFGNGTFTTSGTITGGKIEKFKGAGGNIFLNNGTYGEVHFIMNGGEISNGQIPVGNEAIYEGADAAHQNYGANIRAYNIQEMQLLGGTISGGIGGDPEREMGRDVYVACSDIETTLTIGSVTINGAIHLAKHKLTLKDAPVINSVDGENALTVGEAVEVNISGLTEGADVEFSNLVANVPFTVACENAETVAQYISVINTGAALDVVDGQLILTGVAIVNGEEITWYADNAAAVAAYTYADGKYIQLGLDTALVLAGGEYLIDLAGNVAGEVAITGTGTAHLFDSANTDFNGFRTATVADTVTLAERDHTVILDEEAVRFIIVTDAEGKTSAHALAMAITDVNLRTDAAGLYYSANYKCDEVLAELVSAYGVILSLNDMPGAVKTSDDQRTELTDFAPGTYATSSSVSGIFKDTRTAAKNAAYGKMKIYANAYIQLDVDGDGVADVLVADTENAGKKAGNAWSLHDVLTTIDQNWADYADDQDAVKAFYDNWFDLGMSEYADDFTNIDVKIDVEGGEGEGVTPEDTDVDVEV